MWEGDPVTGSGIHARRALIPRYNPRTVRRGALVAAGGVLAGWLIGLAGTYVVLVYVTGD